MQPSCVTAKTALRLKDKGFPQPEPAFGQIWYDKAGDCFVVTHIAKNQLGIVFEDGLREVWSPSEELLYSEGCFAPTALDILRHLQGECLELNIDYRTASGESWSVGQFSNETNVHEAAAESWFADQINISK